MTETQVALREGMPLSEIPQERKPTKGETAKKVGKTTGFYLIMLVLALFFLFPFFVMICISLLTDSDVYSQVLFSPDGIIELGNYISMFSAGSSYLKYLLNTTIVAVISAVGIPLMSALCAFGFSKMHFHGRDVVFSLVLATLMLPGVVTMLPLYAIYAKIKWTDTLLPLFVPALFGGGATNIFLLRQFFRGIPDDLLNAAKIDGAGTLRIFVQFCMPLCVPALLYVGYMSFTGAWNNFAGPMMYLSRGSEWTTLALGLYYDYGPLSNSLANSAMAAGAVMTLPCIVLFIFFQKYLIEGVSVTGLKG